MERRQLGRICYAFFALVGLSATFNSLRAQNSCGCQEPTFSLQGGMEGGFFDQAVMGEPSPASKLAFVDNPAEVIYLTVVVDEKAIVTINGEPTYTKGTVRKYIVRHLEAGKSYNFKIEALVKHPSGAEFKGEANAELKAGSSDEKVLRLKRVARSKPADNPIGSQATGASTDAK